MRFEALPGNPTQYGATITDKGINFTFTGKEGSKIVFYKKGTTDIKAEVLITTDMLFGNVCSVLVADKSVMEYDYNFIIDGKTVTDKYAKAVNGRGCFGVADKPVTAVIVNDDFDWEDEKKPAIAFDDTIIYKMHVRGFTKDESSKVKHKGTFLGIKEKIAYLKSLGITMVELMPAYDFDEVIMQNANVKSSMVNYWGYTTGYYFAPKASFASNSDDGAQVNEFKDLVKALHRENIEVCMEFYFDDTVKVKTITDCIEYWVLNYHIDGVHIMGNNKADRYIMQNELLSDIKIIGMGMEPDGASYYDKCKKHFGVCNEGFLIAARRFLKGDEDQIAPMVHNIKVNPYNKAIINYVANHGQFTLFDTVSYECKHNEQNGENNHDGPQYNYSWNWGVEGATKKTKVIKLRKKQMKNALSFLFLSQATPLLYMGDERCNTQFGNNNPYCQDNEISWLNWNLNATAKEIYEYTRFLINFRKQHKILHMPDEMRQMDYLSKGLPDISFHGTKAWNPDFDHVNRHFSVMFCADYSDSAPNEDIYIAFNMNWEEKNFGLPVAGKNKKWHLLFTTEETTKGIDINNPNPVDDKVVVVSARTVAVFVAK